MWGVKQNKGRETYLSSYFAVDNVDHMVAIAAIHYITWKYWHMPMWMALSMTVVAVYAMYIEFCEGKLDEAWFMEKKKRMSFQKFCLTLSEKMLTYRTKKNLYPGNSKMRSFTQRSKKQHKKCRRRWWHS